VFVLPGSSDATGGGSGAGLADLPASALPALATAAASKSDNQSLQPGLRMGATVAAHCEGAVSAEGYPQL
jgi:hypothetical protein